MISNSLNADAQPRERARLFGIESLSNADLLAIILRTGVHGYPITDLCCDLMKANDNLFLNLERRSKAEIMEINGIGELKAQQIEAVMEIVRRYSRESLKDLVQISGPDSIFQIMRPEIGNLPHEEIWVILLNRSNRIIGKYCSSKGGGTASVFDIKKIMRRALAERAEAIVLCHNHPSGNLRPSSADDAITRKCKEACKSLDLTLLDHLIITADSYFSYRDSTSII